MQSKLSLKRILVTILIFGLSSNIVLAQVSQSSLYVPLIGITSVPNPLALPNGPGNVTYKYAVKNFLEEVTLTGVQVVDDKCSPVKFTEGDDNNDSKLDYSETWRYACTTKISTTTQSTATVSGFANNIISATHKAYATIVVGSEKPAPLVSIVNVTKVAYPLSLPVEGGPITFTYKVNNPGMVSLSDVAVNDDKCSAMSSKLGDVNNNNLLDTSEVWIYTCTTNLTRTTTNTVNVTAFANGLKAVGEATITVEVKNSTGGSPNFPDTGTDPNLKVTLWGTLSGILAILVIFFLINRKKKLRNNE
jgi:LPXTG-motif cell wall-anchored protein